MATAATRQAALSGYASLFRTVTQVFGKDVHAVNTAKVAIRDEFRKHASEGSSARIGELLRDIEEARSFLVHNVVQAELNDDGNYAVKIEPQHVEESNSDVHLQVARPHDEVENFGLDEACMGEEHKHTH